MLGKQSVHTVLLVLLAFGLAAVVIQAVPANQTISTSPLPVPSRFDSPLPLPLPCPSTTKWATLAIEVKVEGLKGKHIAELQLLTDTSQTAACLSAQGTRLPELDVGNGSRNITIADIPDGFYKLIVDAPTDYFRDPAGYLFQVKDGQIVRHPSFVFRFHLVPPTEQDLPPCREFEKRFTLPPSDSEPDTRDIPADTQKDACQAECTVDISTPPKRPERPHETEVLDVGYHYAGPMTTQDNQGVWGRNTVVDPNVPHPGPAGNRFVVERVYANDASWDHWIEAGWGEVSWRDDRQYIYEFDTVNNTWIFFDEYNLASGSRVETDVQYDPNLGMWKARYHLGGGYWRVLMTADIGFMTASQGYNRGEVYTADGVHPILPLSGFDKGYLLIDGVWRIWDTRYWTVIARNDPYQCDMLTQYYRFNIHSPIVFIPLVLKNAQ
jgi:hypothetical protein